LADSRKQVAVLARRRDEIAAELSQLSGVIQALAVPTDADATAGPAAPPPSHDETDDEEDSRP